MVIAPSLFKPLLLCDIPGCEFPLDVRLVAGTKGTPVLVVFLKRACDLPST